MDLIKLNKKDALLEKKTQLISLFFVFSRLIYVFYEFLITQWKRDSFF